MDKITPASSSIIPTVDLSPFIDGGDESGRKKARHTIFEACTNLGVFQIENHCVSFDMCDRLMELSKTFFNYPELVKTMSTEIDHLICGSGYYKRPIDAYHDFEYVLMYSPGTPFNGVPNIPPQYRKTFEEVYPYFLKTAQILEEIINDCLGLPPNFLKEYNNDRSSDFLIAMNYPPSSTTGDIGIFEHEDPDVMTIVLEDEVCGLEVLKDGEWISITPTKGKLVVIVGDVIQDLSNKMFKNVTHRALRHKGINRHAIDFAYTLQGDKWVEPLPELTQETGVKPKYRGFVFQDYMKLKIEDDKNPPANPKDFINLTYYEI